MNLFSLQDIKSESMDDEIGLKEIVYSSEIISEVSLILYEYIITGYF